jgi:hypothetical protein
MAKRRKHLYQLVDKNMTVSPPRNNSKISNSLLARKRIQFESLDELEEFLKHVIEHSFHVEPVLEYIRTSYRL